MDVSMTKLIRVRNESVAVTRDVLPSEVPLARRTEVTVTVTPAGKPVRLRHGARHGRHARTSEARSSRGPSLSIRSAEVRRWSADLTGPGAAGLVIHGMGGIGKSTLAAQIAARVTRVNSGRVVSVLSGEIDAASFAVGPTPDAEADFIICDNFDDNLWQESGRLTVRDPALAAVLANWTGKLLITCRRPFTLTAGFDGPPRSRANRTGLERLTFRQLGPLTHSGATELATALPAVRQLAESERDLVWRLTAGHPLAMGYLDSLLSRGERYPDIAGRIEATIQARTGQPRPRTEPTELSETMAEVIARAAGDQLFGELFDRLSAGARALLVRASVFRVPVAPEILAAKPGQIAECEAAGLLTLGSGRELLVHRWTADELHRRLAEADLGTQITAAHRQAAGYWRGGAAASPRAELEGGHHERRAIGVRQPEPLTGVAFGTGASRGRRRVIRLGVAGAFAVVSVVLAVEAAQTLSITHLASSDAAAQTSTGTTVTEAAAARDQAAAWVARQVSGAAILACDPAMCSALIQGGVLAENLLVLGSGAADPLGSDVVLATAAVRAMFGSRLTSVYAPEVLASFGPGAARIDVRVVAPEGAAAYRAALTADLRARQVAGQQLLRDPRIALTPSARAQLASGQVDARLLITLATLAAREPVRVKAFSDDGPGASLGMPLRAAELVASRAGARDVLAFFRAQRAPYLPAQTGLAPGGDSVLTVEYAAPSPLGLLQTQS
jgi:hypothetical protein